MKKIFLCISFFLALIHAQELPSIKESTVNIDTNSLMQLNNEELANIAQGLPQHAVPNIKTEIFAIIDAETRYFRNPDAATLLKPEQRSNTRIKTENIYLQFLYYKDIAHGKEYLSHQTNRTRLYNAYGVYNMRIGLLKENVPVFKPAYHKWGEIEFTLFSKFRFAPQNTYKEQIRFVLYGQHNKKTWTKLFSFNLKQAQVQQFQGGIYGLTLSHLLEKTEIEELRLLFNANPLIFGKIEGSLNSFAFDWKPATSDFYQVFLDYGKNNRYF